MSIQRLRWFLPIGLLLASGCVVHTRDVRSVPVAEPEYLYSGQHPVPPEYGDGWCFIDQTHSHPYSPPAQYYQYSGRYYSYNGPVELWYYDAHPIPMGGYCYIGGRHVHDYVPGAYYRDYAWDRHRAGYIYRGRALPPPGYHPASPPAAPPPPPRPLPKPQWGRPARPPPPAPPPPARPQPPPGQVAPAPHPPPPPPPPAVRSLPPGRINRQQVHEQQRERDRERDRDRRPPPGHR